MSAKDAQIEAIKELSDDKIAFMVDRLDAEYREREKRSEALYKISEERANDMKEALEDKDTVIKRMWVVLVLQMLIIAAFAGITVTGKVPFVGDISVEKNAAKDK